MTTPSPAPLDAERVELRVLARRLVSALDAMDREPYHRRVTVAEQTLTALAADRHPAEEALRRAAAEGYREGWNQATEVARTGIRYEQGMASGGEPR